MAFIELSENTQAKVAEADRAHKAFMDCPGIMFVLRPFKYRRLFNEAQRTNREAARALNEEFAEIEASWKGSPRLTC